MKERVITKESERKKRRGSIGERGIRNGETESDGAFRENRFTKTNFGFSLRSLEFEYCNTNALVPVMYSP